jgi:hypothetical protein
MKKIVVIAVLVVLALGLFTGVAGAKSNQPQGGLLHDSMEKALAEKLNIPVATVEAQVSAGKSIAQIALDNGVAQADLPAFLLAIRAQALNAAVKDGVITQALADWMAQHGGRGANAGMMNAGTGPCGGTGVPVGSGFQRGARWQQANP